MVPRLKASDAAEWREHWTLVAASMVGLSFAAIASSSLGLFMEPLNQEFGWSRAQVTVGLTVFALIAVPLSPVVGAIIDRWGSRRLALPGMLVTAIAYSLFGFADGSTTQWVVLWILYSLAALTIRNTVWTAAVSGAFTSARGLALGVTLSGSAIAATLIPPITQHLIDSRGWRSAYFWTGAGWGGAVLLLVFLFFFDPQDANRRKGAPGAIRQANLVELPGLTFAKAMRDPSLIKIALATMIVALMNSAIFVHLVPILGERGVSRETAAFMAALAGGMAVAGRLLTGWILDRWANGWINAASLALPAFACLILIFAGNHLSLIALAVVVTGYTLGSFMQICVYLTGRYAGLRNFGKIFGVMSSLIALGTGVGPFLASLLYDAVGDYMSLLIIGIPTALVGGALVFALGPYPVWEQSHG